MASDNDWLPPGWTENMLQTATDEQWDALTQEQYDRITAHQVAQGRAQQAVNDLLFGTAALTTVPTEPQQGLINTNADGSGVGIEANIVDAMQKTGLPEFGFVVFRIYDGDSAGEEEAWKTLKRAWPVQASDGRMWDGRSDEEPTDQFGRPWPVWKWVEESEEQALHSLNVDGIARRYAALQAQGEVPAGLDLGVALAITSASLSAFTSSTNAPASINVERPAMLVPWVYVVDVSHQPDEYQADGAKGYFRASIRSLLPDLWPTLALGVQMPDELEAAVAEGEVWEGVF